MKLQSHHDVIYTHPFPSPPKRLDMITKIRNENTFFSLPFLLYDDSVLFLPGRSEGKDR